MDDKTLMEQLKAMHDLDFGKDFPETAAVIELKVSDDFTSACQSAYDFAEDFMEADKGNPMPPAVADFVKAICEEEIAKGSPEAACLLASMYYRGRGGEQDFGKAVRYYTMASEQGNAKATENLAYCYYYGRSVPVDFEKAFYLYAQGAFEGRLISLYKIGDMYRNGFYVEKNGRTAFRIFRNCVERMDEISEKECGADVYLRIADCYFEGIGTEPDYKAAFVYYQKASLLFIDRIMNGDFYLRYNYRHSVERENQAREMLEKEFPEWIGF